MTRWLLSLLLVAAIAAPAAQAQDTVDVSIGKFATFVDEDTVQAQITVTCVGTVLEAFAYVVQRDHNSDFGFFNPICDGLTRSYTVTIEAAEEETFRRGRARVSAFVLLESGVSASPTRLVVFR
ncbi:MAG: hypothetical protein M3327_04180 [Actinomycetota bacterium]|nr:hypothetical protein [Actinomycetota bacterium]